MPARPPHLLIVDPVEQRRQSLTSALERLGHQVAAVGSGTAARGHLGTHPTDAILLAVDLPAHVPEAFLTTLAADPATRAIPVVILAGASDVEGIERCLRLGAADFVTAPFELALLRARITACLERAPSRHAGGGNDGRLARELAIGRQIQAGFLPATLPHWPGWELSAVFEAAGEVSGDFYDAFILEESLSLGFVVGDVCGKGVGAALFMALFRSLIRAVATQVVSSGLTLKGDSEDRLFAALRLANDYIADTHGDANMFATAFAAVINPRNGVVLWANAGHEPALVIRADGGVRERLAPSGPALGLMPEITLARGTTRLAPGETLLISTDGVSEARASDGAFFGDERLVALCESAAGGATALTARVTDAVHAFAAGAEPADDVTLVAVHRGPAKPRPEARGPSSA